MGRVRASLKFELQGCLRLTNGLRRAGLGFRLALQQDTGRRLNKPGSR